MVTMICPSKFAGAREEAQTQTREGNEVEKVLYPAQGHGGSKAHPRNTRCEAGIQAGWDASSSQGTTHTQIHTRSHLARSPT